MWVGKRVTKWFASHRRKWGVFLGLSLTETILIGVWLLRIPADAKHAIALGFSAQRLLALGALVMAGIAFCVLGVLSLRSQLFELWAANVPPSSKTPRVLGIGLAIVALVSGFLLFLPPPALIPAQSALAKRLTPLLVWTALMSSQGLFLFISIFSENIQSWADELYGRLRGWMDRPQSGYILLLISVLVATTQVYYVYYNLGDEGDTFAVGWLIARGWRLYKDIFSHHFPFPYFWVALIVKVFGASLFAVRFSFILLRALLFLIAMRLSGYRFALGMTALAWSVVGHLYLGNSLIYHSFSGILLLSAFSIGLAIIRKDIQPGNLALSMVGVFLGLAVLTDPMKVFPAAIAVLAILLSSWGEHSISGGLREGLSRVGVISLGIAACMLLFGVYLIATGTGDDFYRDAILFNEEIYSKYSPAVGIREILQPAVSGLDILNKRRTAILNPHFAWQFYQSIDNWVFTGFFYRAAILLGTILFLTRRRFLSALYLYLFGAAVLIRFSDYFHASPFALLSFFVISFLLSGHLEGPIWGARKARQFSCRSPLKIAMRGFAFLSLAVIFFMFAWLSIRGGGYLIKNRSKMSFSENFSALEGNAAFYRKATCYRREARILVYPLDPIQYFLAQIPPASRFLYMTPWTAEVGQAEVIAALERKPTLVYVNREASVWGFEATRYLKDLIGYLETNYEEIETNYFISPQLSSFCPPNAHQ
jgi:hypothetical protein